jgi:hypothetical protein
MFRIQKSVPFLVFLVLWLVYRPHQMAGQICTGQQLHNLLPCADPLVKSIPLLYCLTSLTQCESENCYIQLRLLSRTWSLLIFCQGAHHFSTFTAPPSPTGVPQLAASSKLLCTKERLPKNFHPGPGFAISCCTLKTSSGGAILVRRACGHGSTA